MLLETWTLELAHGAFNRKSPCNQCRMEERFFVCFVFMEILLGDQSWVFFGRNDAKAETPVLWPSHAKSWLIGQDPDAGRAWGQEEKVTTEDEMAGWHHWLNGREFEWAPGVGDGQGGLACCDSWGCKESDTTERLNWTELNPGIWSLWDLPFPCHSLLSHVITPVYLFI